MGDTLTRTETLEGAIGGPHGSLRITYETLQSLCGGNVPEACLITPSVRCSIWLTGKSHPSLKHAKARTVGYMALRPGDTLSIEPVGQRLGRVRIVPIPKGSSELHVPLPRIGRPTPVVTT